MLSTVEQPGPSPDALELSLETSERVISQIRAIQIQALLTLDTAQVAARDGARSLPDWVAAHLDVSAETARSLVEATKLLEEHPASAGALAEGDVTFDRAVATARLAVAGAGDEAVAASSSYDIAGVRRLAARRRRITVRSERETFTERYVALQPCLDEAFWRLWGQLPGIEGRLVEAALTRRGDSLPRPPQPGSRIQRHADALVAMAQDSLDGDGQQTPVASTVPVVSVFIDADIAADARGEAGAEIAAGPPVGPATLERLLCEGRIQVIGLHDHKPVTASAAARAIPAATRRFVLWRDGGCVIDGCSSRSRLQPHHITPRSQGGNHHPDNLATLCWYHHHVAIHGTGFRLDPESPPQRRKLIPTNSGPDPPVGRG